MVSIRPPSDDLDKNLIDSLADTISQSTPELRLDKKRWFILFLFSITTMANACLFSTISAITDIATQYYGVESTIIDWIPNSFILTFIIIAIPTAYFMKTQGLRKCMISATSFHVVATSLHFAGVSRNGFPFFFAGQMFCAFGAGVVLQLPPRLSTVWFDTNEHAKATSIGMFANIIGVAVGFLQPTHMVPCDGNMKDAGKGLFNLYLSQLIFCVVNLGLVCIFYKEAPEYPPTYAALQTSASYDGDNKTNIMPVKDSLTVMLKDKHNLLLANAYGFYFGLYVFVTICLNELVKPIVSDDNIGWMGFSYNCFGIFGIIVCSILIDRFKCYKLIGGVLTFGALGAWVTFSYILLYIKTELYLFILYSAQGLFGVPFFAIGVEQVAEMTYPIPEGTSAAVLMILGNLNAFILILVLGTFINNGQKDIVCYTVAAIYLITFILLLCTKTHMKRQEVEESREPKELPTSSTSPPPRTASTFDRTHSTVA